MDERQTFLQFTVGGLVPRVVWSDQEDAIHIIRLVYISHEAPIHDNTQNTRAGPTPLTNGEIPFAPAVVRIPDQSGRQSPRS